MESAARKGDEVLSVTYLSSATEVWKEEELVDLLHHARAENTRRDVTGVLLYSGGNFIQTLEGPDEAVDEVLAKVVQDPRHAGVHVVRREDVDERAFGEWSMGFRRLAEEEVAEIPGFTDYLHTGRVDGASTRKHAAATFHRIFRRHVRDTHEWQGPGRGPDLAPDRGQD